jgi:hypothetical protein
MSREFFYEEQRFNQWWLWLVIILVTLVMIGMAAHGLIVQIGREQPVGDKPMPDTGLIIFSVLAVIIASGIIWVLVVARLEIKIDKWGVHYRYAPFISQWRFIPKQDIEAWKVGRYFAGGYGIRLGLRYTTYNVKGFIGLALKLRNQRNIRLGTQKGEAIQSAMEQLFKKEII